MTLKWNITQNRMLPKMERHLNGISLKMECHSKWNVNQNGISLKMECHLKWDVT